MIRSSFGSNRYNVGIAEKDLIVGSRKTWAKTRKQGVLYLHGSGGTAETTADSWYDRQIIDSIGKFATVCAGDWGLQAWGNATGVARINDGDIYLDSQWGTEGKKVIVCGSMGFANACAFTKAHPEKVAAIAAMIPLCDLQDLVDLGYGAQVGAAYGGMYDNAVHGPDHNPLLIAPTLDPDLPIHFWTASNDPLTRPATQDAFVAARPQTGRTNVGPLGHSVQAMYAAMPELVRFVRKHSSIS